MRHPPDRQRPGCFGGMFLINGPARLCDSAPTTARAIAESSGNNLREFHRLEDAPVPRRTLSAARLVGRKLPSKVVGACVRAGVDRDSANVGADQYAAAAVTSIVAESTVCLRGDLLRVEGSPESGGALRARVRVARCRPRKPGRPEIANPSNRLACDAAKVGAGFGIGTRHPSLVCLVRGPSAQPSKIRIPMPRLGPLQSRDAHSS